MIFLELFKEPIWTTDIYLKLMIIQIKTQEKSASFLFKKSTLSQALCHIYQTINFINLKLI